LDVLIVGGGLTGTTLAARLAANRHDVVVVEQNADHARRLSSELDVQVIEGDGASGRVLREAGIERADIVIAMTERDDVNLLVSVLAARVFRVPRLLARLRDADHIADFAQLAGDHSQAYRCFNPDDATVDRILALLDVPGALDVFQFQGGSLVVAGFRIGESSDFAGLVARDMSLLFADQPTLVVAIQRDGSWIVPNGSEVLREGDIAYFAIARSDLGGVVSLVRGEQAAERPRRGDRARVFVAGATRIGMDLARRLDSRDWQVVLLEPDPQRARGAAEELDDVVVVNGRPTDQALLEEEGIERAAAFVAVTTDYEDNLVSSLLARRLGVERAFALVDNPDLVHLVGEIAIDAIVSPRLVAVSIALAHVRGGGVRSVAALLEHEVELIEGVAREDAPLVLGTLNEIGVPAGTLVAAVTRGERTFVPRGRDRVRAGDQVVLVTSSERAPEVARLLGAAQE
jgi:trk system potassium uptake protein TrkA